MIDKHPPKILTLKFSPCFFSWSHSRNIIKVVSGFVQRMQRNVGMDVWDSCSLPLVICSFTRPAFGLWNDYNLNILKCVSRYAHILWAGVFLWFLPACFDMQETSAPSFVITLFSCSQVWNHTWNHLNETMVLQFSLPQVFSAFILFSYSFSLSPPTSAFPISMPTDCWNHCVPPLPSAPSLLLSCCRCGTHSSATPTAPPLCSNLFVSKKRWLLF